MGLTRHLTTPAPTLHKSADTAALTVTAALSVEVLDRAGDIVVPRGVDLRVHKADPWAGVEHYRHRGGEWVIPGAGEEHLPPVRVGVAKLPDNTYGVELKAMPGHGDVLFATTRFDPSDRLSLQTFRLVEDGTLDGTSVEIARVHKGDRPLAPSPLENRMGLHIERCTLLGYAHCAVPVNQAALVCKALTPAIEQSIRVAQTGRVGSEPAHPLILKALGRFVPAGKTTTVTSGYTPPPVERKAMNDTTPAAMEPAYEPEPDGDEAADALGAGGITAAYDAAQQGEELADHYESVADMTDSPELARDMLAAAAKQRAVNEKVKAAADKAQAKKDAVKTGAEPEEPADDAPVDMEKDDDGVIKSMAAVHYKAVKASWAKRFTKAEVAAAPTVTPEALTPPAPASPDDITPEYVAGLKKSNPKLYRTIVRELEKLSALGA